MFTTKKNRPRLLWVGEFEVDGQIEVVGDLLMVFAVEVGSTSYSELKGVFTQQGLKPFAGMSSWFYENGNLLGWKIRSIWDFQYTLEIVWYGSRYNFTSPCAPFSLTKTVCFFSCEVKIQLQFEFLDIPIL